MPASLHFSFSIVTARIFLRSYYQEKLRRKTTKKKEHNEDCGKLFARFCA